MIKTRGILRSISAPGKGEIKMIKLFTDTSANLPLQLIHKHNIQVVSFEYTVDGVTAEYSAETDFDGPAFYDMVFMQG